jgi:hypothetical protein
MFFIPHTIPPVWSTEQQTLILSQTVKPTANIKSSDWQSLLEGVYDNQLEFEVKPVAIHKRDGKYFKESYSVDNPPPLPLISLDVEVNKLPERYNYYYDNRVFILNSPKIYWLSNTNNPKVLDELIQLLDSPGRAWAANIILAKMLGKASLGDFDIRVGKANQWWESKGKVGKAKQEWAAYLNQVKPTLRWSTVGGYYKHTDPSGEKVP